MGVVWTSEKYTVWTQPDSPYQMYEGVSIFFLPEANIGLRVLSRLASMQPSISPSVRHQVCLHDNSTPVQARITKFGPYV